MSRLKTATASLTGRPSARARPAALGVLFLSPFSLQAFEEEAGSTNASTVRAESNGLFLVQRPDAAATIAGAGSS